MIVASACGCVGIAEKETGDTAGPTGPATITGATVSCDGALTVTLEAQTDNPAAGGQVFAIDSGNDIPWAETHDLDLIGSSLVRTLTTCAYPCPDLDEYVRNTSSVFSCAQHFEQPVMSYAFFATDASGAVSDCVAGGENGTAVIDGSAASINGVEPDYPRSACREATVAR
jgi:hypothetical protein